MKAHNFFCPQSGQAFSVLLFLTCGLMWARDFDWERSTTPSSVQGLVFLQVCLLCVCNWSEVHFVCHWFTQQGFCQGVNWFGVNLFPGMMNLISVNKRMSSNQCYSACSSNTLICWCESAPWCWIL